MTFVSLYFETPQLTQPFPHSLAQSFSPIHMLHPLAQPFALIQAIAFSVHFANPCTFW
jgi:hypothetical protein